MGCILVLCADWFSTWLAEKEMRIYYMGRLRFDPFDPDRTIACGEENHEHCSGWLDDAQTTECSSECHQEPHVQSYVVRAKQ